MVHDARRAAALARLLKGGLGRFREKPAKSQKISFAAGMSVWLQAGRSASAREIGPPTPIALITKAVTGQLQLEG